MLVFYYILLGVFSMDNMMANGMDAYDRVMSKVLNVSKVKQGQIEDMMNKVAYHESAGTMDPAIKQHGGGPGRGMFQYELSSGKGSGAGRTAMNRLYAVLGGDLINGVKPDNMPKWIEPYFKKDDSGNLMPHGDVDFSKLTDKQQKTLFLADKLKTKGAIPSLGTVSESDWWAEYHHKGANSNKVKFSDDVVRYLSEKASK